MIVCDARDLRVDFIEAQRVLAASVGSQRADAEPDDADPLC